MNSEERSLLDLVESLTVTAASIVMVAETLAKLIQGKKARKNRRKTRRRSRGEGNLPFFLRVVPQDENDKKSCVSGLCGGVSAGSFSL